MSSVVISGDTSGTVTVAAPAVAGSNTLTLQAATATNAVNTYSSTVNTTSGTAALYSSIPSWVKKITIGLSSVTYASTSLLNLQLGTSGGLTTSGYTGYAYTPATPAIMSTSFLLQAANNSGNAHSGIATLMLVDSTNNIWAFSAVGGGVGTNTASIAGGRVALASVLTQLQISTVAGTTFSAGAVNVLFEG